MITTLPSTSSGRVLPAALGSEVPWLRDGWRMAKREGTAVFELITNKYAAVIARHKTLAQELKARGRLVTEQKADLERSLAQRGYDPGRHFKELAQGKADLIAAIGLSVLTAALVVFVLLAFGPSWL